MTSIATIVVSFDCKEAAPGDTLTGKVFLWLSQPVDATSISCRVVGQESTSVVYSTTSHSGEDEIIRYHTAREARNFVDFSFCVQQFPNGRILAGQYAYPFQFTLPDGCPASLTAGDQRNHCDVQYHLEVRLDCPGVMQWDVRHQQPFTVINSPSSSTKTPIYIEPSTSELRTLGVMNRGDIVIGGLVENSTLEAGETTVVKYAVQNQSSLRVNAIKVSLVEVITFRAQGHSTARVTKLYRKRMVARDCPLDLSPMRGTTIDEDQARRTINEVLRSDATSLQLTVPVTARCDYAGGLISITHELVIKVCTPFGTSNPQVSRPVYVGSSGAQVARQQHASFFPSSTVTGGSPAVVQAVLLPTIARAATAVSYQGNQIKRAQQMHQAAGNAGPAVAIAQPVSDFAHLQNATLVNKHLSAFEG